ncbi:hypothetical protein BGX21_007346, partial [Mortierella sp. AD011]
GIDFQGNHLEPVVPTPPSFKTWKINFRNLPPDLKKEDIQKIFGPYGEILEIGRYYWQINNYRVLTGEGFIFFEQPLGKYIPLPEFINWGEACIQTKITVPPKGTPQTASMPPTRHLPPPNRKQSEPSTVSHSNTNRKKKRNSKKRLKKNDGERAHPAESDQMEDVQLTGAPASTEQHTRQQENSSANTPELPQEALGIVEASQEVSLEEGIVEDNAQFYE